MFSLAPAGGWRSEAGARDVMRLVPGEERMGEGGISPSQYLLILRPVITCVIMITILLALTQVTLGK